MTIGNLSEATGQDILAAVEAIDAAAPLKTTAGVQRVAQIDASTVIVDMLATGNEKTSPASNTYAVTTPVTGLSVYRAIVVYAKLVGGTGGTLDTVLETTDGTNWFEYYRFRQVAAAATAYERYNPVLDGTGVVVGGNQTTAFVLAQGAAANGHWGDSMRVRFVAGSGTSAGAVQSIKIAGVRDTA